jgi:uncharacterized protein (TIGR03437 family)
MKTSTLRRILAAACVILPLAASPSANVQLSTETVPSGGWVEIKFTLTKPQLIASGEIVMDLDPAVFGPIQAAGVFGANGDAYGLATIAGEHLDAQFYSPSAGIGQLAGLPVLVVSVPVLPLAARANVSITATVTLNDISGNAYSVTVIPGSVTVGGAAFSVQTVQSGMGVLPAGSIVPILGTGFTASTTATMDGVAISSTKFVSATEIDLTLAAPTELTGKQLRLTGSGIEVDYFCFDVGSPQQVPTGLPFYIVLTGAQPMFPLQASAASEAFSADLGGVVAIENPQATPVTLQLQTFDYIGDSEGTASVTLPAGGWGIYSSSGHNGGTSVTASAPVRVVGINRCGLNPPTNCPGSAIPSSALLTPPQPVATPASVSFQWQIGSAAPASRLVFIDSYNFPLSAAATTSSGGTWLSVTQSGSTGEATLTVTADPSKLTLGTYQGSLIVTSSYFYGIPLTIPVSLTVTSAAPPLLTASASAINFSVLSGRTPPTNQAIAVTSDGGPVPFSVTVEGTWLQVTPSSGTTPATLTVTYNLAVTSQIDYQQRMWSGTILITGPGNSLVIPALFTTTGLLTFQPNLVFSAQTGTVSQTQTIPFDPPGAVTTSVDAPWLTAAVSTLPTITVTANPAGLAPAVYHGTVTITEPGVGSLQVPVTFGVWSTPPPLQVTPSSLTFVQQVGEGIASNQYLNVQSNGVPVNLSITATANWLGANDPENAPTPTTLGVGIGDASLMPLGEYNANVAITAPSGTVNVPVTLLVTPGPVAQPVLASIVNGASQLPGGVSPGEILTIRGYGVGASQPTNLQLTGSLQVETTAGGAQVLFDGKPAPIVFTSAYQTSVMVPYEVQNSTNIQVIYSGLSTGVWGVPVVPTAPAIFTTDATGTGQGAILNQDNSVNGASKPAARGSVIQIYATGEGQTSPQGVTGSVNGTNLKKPVLPVNVSIGGIDAVVQYAGSAPGEISGVLQVNVVVPQAVTPGSSVPVLLTIGSASSQAGVTVAVQ